MILLEAVLIYKQSVNRKNMEEEKKIQKQKM